MLHYKIDELLSFSIAFEYVHSFTHTNVHSVLVDNKNSSGLYYDIMPFH